MGLALPSAAGQVGVVERALPPPETTLDLCVVQVEVGAHSALS